MPQALTGVEAFRDWIYVAVVAMEVFTVVIIVAGIILGAATFLQVFFQRGDHQDAYRTFKLFMGRTLLLGLEILVAADIVNTVALKPTAERVLVLGLLVLVRTFLGWSLVVELEGRWPWQQPEPHHDPHQQQPHVRSTGQL